MNTGKSILHIFALFLFCMAAVGCAASAYKSIDAAAFPPQYEPPAPPAETLADTYKAPESTKTEAEPPVTRRKIHYNGFVKLRVQDPPDVMDAAADAAQAAGGYVERMDKAYIVLRIPVEAFQRVFQKILTLGLVLDKSITAQDITDSYNDVELRLKIAQATRRRLMALLERAETEKEKLKLLQEIQRINEKIERLLNHKTTLSHLAQFSRLTVHVVPRPKLMPRQGRKDVSEFMWIHALSPFKRAVARQGKALEFTIPREMVALDKKKLWICESADGAAFWASRRDNTPKGDTRFWFEAVRLRLAPEFKTAEIKTAGKFKVLRLVDRSDKPYVYLVGVHARKSRLHLVEAYLPSLEHERRYGKSIFDSIEKGPE